jgi:hypothetical protein
MHQQCGDACRFEHLQHVKGSSVRDEAARPAQAAWMVEQAQGNKEEA